MLGTGFKNQEKELNHILGLSKAKRNPLVFQNLTKAVQIRVADQETK